LKVLRDRARGFQNRIRNVGEIEPDDDLFHGNGRGDGNDGCCHVAMEISCLFKFI